MEATLALIKPDAVRAGLTGKIIRVIEENEFIITAMKMVKMTGFQAANFYGTHKDKPFYKDLVEFTMSGPMIAIVLVGEDVVAKWRTLMGATNPAEAEEGTIRAMYGSKEVIRYNAVHGSESVPAASFEIRFMFNCFEL